MVQDLIESLIRVEYGVEASDSSVLQLLYSLPTVQNNQVEVIGNSDELYRIEGGSSQLIKQLVNNLDSQQITINQPLKAITKQDQKLLLTFNNFQKNVDYLILALPNTALRKIKINLPLSANLQRFIQEVSLGTNQKIFAGFQSSFWQQEKGFSQEAWTDIGASEI
jgi:monoamine oxidase